MHINVRQMVAKTELKTRHRIPIFTTILNLLEIVRNAKKKGNNPINEDIWSYEGNKQDRLATICTYLDCISNADE